MSKRKGPGKPPSRRGGGDPGNPGGRRRLPYPNISVPASGADGSKFGPAEVKGIIMNPVYAGVGEYPRMVPEEEWVAAARRVLAEDGPDQFLVNLLYVLRRTFGCDEWGGYEPPDVN